ncbi:YlmC/YmxH family sporulation protein [Bacillus mesophilus]|uniref:YlmC/YmxH family sporulation protein n=1 Tax=Bacillus mesophilus TaxID=1808955 RepID=A0A6M0Q231_9BACI|nr:YlmC/YmxH family sporulation protein [Bacillus mesophilus]MBM7659444.1 YlmC/YmxH family sporulation protein [Bacillus mesophilus]NEY70317.1 YlmC/YmxH family sporulation protein [Bacillus mesophilus]
MVKISEFQIKDVVNVADGKKLGNIDDLEINTTTGKIDSIVISSGTRMLGFLGRGEEVIIPWRNIVKIGADVILVRFYQSGEEYHDSQN